MSKINIKSFIPILITSTLVSIGIATGMVIAPVRAQSTYASIGYVDVQAALRSHPNFESVMTQISNFERARIEEMSDYGNISTLSETQRQQLMEELYRVQDEVDAERQRLTEPMIQQVIDATTSVGQESGIEVILEAGSVMWGGLNLTPLIIQRIQGN